MLRLWIKLPVFSANEVGYCAFGNPVLFSKLSVSNISSGALCPYFAGFIPIKLSSVSHSAWRKLKTAFLHCIMYVVFCCSKEKMIWIKAPRNIASMTDVFPSRNWSFVNEVRQSVRRIISLIKTYVSIPVIIHASPPNLTVSNFCTSIEKQPFNFNFIHKLHVEYFARSVKGGGL